MSTIVFMGRIEKGIKSERGSVAKYLINASGQRLCHSTFLNSTAIFNSPFNMNDFIGLHTVISKFWNPLRPLLKTISRNLFFILRVGYQIRVKRVQRVHFWRKKNMGLICLIEEGGGYIGVPLVLMVSLYKRSCEKKKTFNFKRYTSFTLSISIQTR